VERVSFISSVSLAAAVAVIAVSSLPLFNLDPAIELNLIKQKRRLFSIFVCTYLNFITDFIHKLRKSLYLIMPKIFKHAE